MTEVALTPTEKAAANVGAGKDDLENKGQSDLGIPTAPVDDGKGKKPTKEELEEKHSNVEQSPADKRAAAAAAKEAADKLAAEADEAEGEQREAWDGEYVQMENEGAQAAIDLLKESNVDPREANSYFEEALKTGDITKVKWAELEKKLGKSKTFLIRQGVEKYHTEVLKKTTDTVAAAYEIVGGEENWKAVRTWAQAAEKADPKSEIAKMLPEYRAALEQGGWAAKKAVEALKEAYNKAPNTKGLGVAKLIQGNSTPAVSGDTISKADYLVQMKALHEKGARPAEINALRLRRNQSRAAGIN